MNAPTPDCDSAWRALRSILDPEFGINIVDLGLIYSVECSAGRVDVMMTLTTPNCPAGAWLKEGAKQALAAIPGATDVNVELIFDPAWNPAMLSEIARRELGVTS